MPVAREVDDHQSQRRDKDGDRCQAARPRPRLAVPTLAEDVAHRRTAKENADLDTTIRRPA
jgi:hypothetical protein